MIEKIEIGGMWLGGDFFLFCVLVEQRQENSQGDKSFELVEAAALIWQVVYNDLSFLFLSC